MAQKNKNDNDNGRAKIREVYELFNKLKDNFDNKLDPIEVNLATLIAKINTFTDNCKRTTEDFNIRIRGNTKLLGNIKIKAYGIAAGISVFSIIIGALIGKYLLI